MITLTEFGRLSIGVFGLHLVIRIGLNRLTPVLSTVCRLVPVPLPHLWVWLSAAPVGLMMVATSVLPLPRVGVRTLAH